MVNLKELKNRLELLKSQIDELNKDMEEMRAYYKHQSTEEDDSSESAILCWQSVREINHVIQYTDELLEIESEWE